MEINKVYLGNNIDILKTFEDNSIDSIVCDPPYGLGKEPNAEEILRSWLDTGDHEIKGKGFMGKEWDAFVPSPAIWKECYRVLKPGGHLLAFFGTRTYDYGTLAIRLAGFEIRDMLAWLYGSGFPKSLNIAKAIESLMLNGSSNKTEFKKLDGEKATVSLGYHKLNETQEFRPNDYNGRETTINHVLHTAEAKQWEGYGTALKPALEPICMARKPIAEENIAENVLKYGTGGINIDGCRVGDEKLINKGMSSLGIMHVGNWKPKNIENEVTGRYPSNLLHDGSEGVVSCFPNTKGEIHNKLSSGDSMFLADNVDSKRGFSIKDSGSAARFFKSCEYTEEDIKSIYYCSKANQKERNEGLDGFEYKNNMRVNAPRNSEEEKTSNKVRNTHCTVKPIALMRYLVKLVTPKNGIVLDPFVGSGTTCIAAIKEGFNYIGIEREEEYHKIAEARVKYYANLELDNEEQLTIPFD